MNARSIRILWLYAAERWGSFSLPDDKELLDVKMQVWIDHLGDLDDGHVRAALVELGRSDHLPALGLIRDTALELGRLQQGGSRTPQFDEAWAEVMEGVRRHGRRQRPEFTHPLTAEVVKMIGWSAICNTDKPDVVRGQFRQLFTQARTRFLDENQPPPPALTPYRAEGRQVGKRREITQLPRSTNGHDA